MPFSWHGCFSISGRFFANVTVPGPRYFVHLSVTGRRVRTKPGNAPEFDKTLASSATQTGSASGVDIVVERSTTRPSGPCTDAPFSSNLRIGGVSPSDGVPIVDAVLTKGETS